MRPRLLALLPAPHRPGRRLETHYLGEGWAFSHRLPLVGITPLPDATIRLYHYGRHGFPWEEAENHRPRNRSYRFRP